MDRRIRILIGKIGLDGHDIGIKVLSHMLRDAGMEVVFVGGYQTPENVVSVATHEDVDFIGLSFLGGDHLEGATRMMALIGKAGLPISVIVGGIIPRQDFSALRNAGVAEVFEPGSSPDYIISRIHELYQQRLDNSNAA